MSPSGITTRTARTSELDSIIDLCLAAFADEAVTAWLFPEPADRRASLHRRLTTSLDAVITTGTLILAIDPDQGPVAVSIWLPHTTAPDAPKSTPSSVEDNDSRTQHMAAVEAATQARRPDGPFLYLSSMATLPEHRGRGAGAAMLSAGLEQARALDLPVYLEASTSDNRRLYTRLGFRDLGGPIDLPDGGPSLQPMWLDT